VCPTPAKIAALIPPPRPRLFSPLPSPALSPSDALASSRKYFPRSGSASTAKENARSCFSKGSQYLSWRKTLKRTVADRPHNLSAAAFFPFPSLPLRARAHTRTHIKARINPRYFACCPVQGALPPPPSPLPREETDGFCGTTEMHIRDDRAGLYPRRPRQSLTELEIFEPSSTASAQNGLGAVCFHKRGSDDRA